LRDAAVHLDLGRPFQQYACSFHGGHIEPQADAQVDVGQGNVILCADLRHFKTKDLKMDIENAIHPIAIHDLRAACSNCNMRELCMPVGIPNDLLEKLDSLVYVRKKIKAGSALYHAGDKFNALYAVKAGFVKTETLNDDGRVQVTGFYMMGEIFGFDGIASDTHVCTAVALEDTMVCAIPLERIEHISQEFEQLRRHFYKLMSREIVRDHTVMMLLGSMQGEERLAAFLLNLSQRLKDRGYSPYDLVLRMKRDEIGSYLGMKVETVSRAFTRFQDQGLLEVRQKNIRILDVPGLQKLVGQIPCKS
jgi:CRP/FNR family transcriptional regulator